MENDNNDSIFDEPDKKKAYLMALLHLKAKGFYEPEIDNPENIPLEKSEELNEVISGKKRKKEYEQQINDPFSR